MQQVFVLRETQIQEVRDLLETALLTETLDLSTTTGACNVILNLRELRPATIDNVKQLLLNVDPDVLVKGALGLLYSFAPENIQNILKDLLQACQSKDPGQSFAYLDVKYNRASKVNGEI